ncbi:MAG: transcription antitermination factor NusB [Rhodospirillaceae bacterium]|nr:transcription antitermination factor NusB [Rhodospirillaceae bacterium]
MPANASPPLPSDHGPSNTVSRAGINRARSAGRLAAVQALYTLAQSEATADEVLRDFVSGRLGGVAISENVDTGQETYIELPEGDAELLVDLVRCAQARGDEIGRIIAASLSAGWPAERLEVLVRCVLSAGIAELMCRPDIPPRATVSEFVDVAKAFYSGAEPGMVNAVLDRAARALDRMPAPPAP